MVLEVEVHGLGRSFRLVRKGSGWAWNRQALSQTKADMVHRWLSELQLSEGTSLLPTLTDCRPQLARQWRVALLEAGGRLVGPLELVRTKACGDVAGTEGRAWVGLRDTSLIDLLGGISALDGPHS